MTPKLDKAGNLSEVKFTAAEVRHLETTINMLRLLDRFSVDGASETLRSLYDLKNSIDPTRRWVPEALGDE